MSLNYYAIGQRIKAYRLKMNISQMTLSEMIRKSPTYISHIENGNKVMSLETLIDLCNALGVSTDTILFDFLKSPGPANNEIAVLLKDCSRYERLIILEVLKSVKATLRTYQHLIRQRPR